MLISNVDDMQRLANEWGFLPFFAGEIYGFSIEDNVNPQFWFSDDEEQGNGAWDAKADCIIQGDLAYGKFYQGRACYISMEYFPDFVNYRLSCRSLTSQEKKILAVLEENKSLLSGELKRLSGYQRASRRPARTPLEVVADEQVHIKPRRVPSGVESFATAITRLQMTGHVLISDFEYRYTRDGRCTGWGIARYSTPSLFFGAERMTVPRTPAQSYDRLMTRLRQLLPQATDVQLHHFLDYK